MDTKTNKLTYMETVKNNSDLKKILYMFQKFHAK